MERDKDLIAHALLMWRNYIETGNVVLSAGDAARSGQSRLIKPLGTEQKTLVLRLETLAEKVKNENP